MSIKKDVDKGRRCFLIGATSLVSTVGVVGAAVPFVKSWNPSARAKAAGVPVKVDVSQLTNGRMMIVEWRGRPVWIVHRTQQALASLKKVSDELADVDSKNSKQPEYASNEYRSIKPELLVLIGICTHLGCSPVYRPEVNVSENWLGGFFCPCHGSKFDFSGRVYKGVPAPTNLEVPPYTFVDNNILIVGQDQDSSISGEEEKA